LKSSGTKSVFSPSVMPPRASSSLGSEIMKTAGTTRVSWDSFSSQKRATHAQRPNCRQ
jgi:hypothetical protein